MARRIEDLRNEARYWRERHDLYLAKTRGPRATRPGRLKELERTAQAAEARLGRAEAAARTAAGVVSAKP
jgi:hypothetical protein